MARNRRRHHFPILLILLLLTFLALGEILAHLAILLILAGIPAAYVIGRNHERRIRASEPGHARTIQAETESEPEPWADDGERPEWLGPDDNLKPFPPDPDNPDTWDIPRDPAARARIRSQLLEDPRSGIHPLGG